MAMECKSDVCVLGLGPVGTVSGLCYAKQGFRVTGVDVDAARVNALAEGKSPFIEPGIEPLIRETRASGAFRVTQDLQGAVRQAGIVIIAVGTPTPAGAPDLTQIEQACLQTGSALRGLARETIIAIRSTIPPGTIRRSLMPLIEKSSGLRAGKNFHMASNPEFLREGLAVADFFNTGRIIVGADDEETAARVEALYRDVHAGARQRVSIESAEFAKYVDNSWHALKISFANEIGRICRAFGGNVEEMTEIFLSDHRLNISTRYLKPGFAFGGSCLPKDVRGLAHLARHLGVTTPVVHAILPSNEEHIGMGAAAILATHPRRVGLLGVAFKEHIDDVRESPALAVAARLARAGIAVRAHDAAFRPGGALPLGKGGKTLALVHEEELLRFADTLAVMHPLPAYEALAARHRELGKAVIDLTGLPKMPPLKPSARQKHPEIGEIRELVFG